MSHDQPSPDTGPHAPAAGSRQPAQPRAHAGQRLSEQQVAAASQDELRAIGAWVLDALRAASGWDRMAVELKPQGGKVWLRVTEHRDGRAIPGTAGPLGEANPVVRHVLRLQDLAYRPGRGTWFSTTVMVTAHGWPEPEFGFAASHLFDQRPQRLAEEPEYGLDEALVHLDDFPRTQDRIPSWVAQAAADAGVSIRVLPDDAGADSHPQDTIHPLLREAVSEFAASPSDATLIEVLRQCTSGEVLVDASASEMVRDDQGAPTDDSVIRLQSFTESDGRRYLAAYTAATEAQAMFDAHRDASVTGDGGTADPADAPDGTEAPGAQLELLAQPALRMLELVAADDQYDGVIIDASGAACRIPKAQIQWVLSAPRNDVVKNGLIANNVSQVFAGLAASSSVLLLGVRPGADDDAQPVWAQPEPGQRPDTLLVFTSSAEVAALDSSLEVRVAPARDVLAYAVGSGAARICLNAHPPVATFSIESIAQLLETVGAEDDTAR